MRSYDRECSLTEDVKFGLFALPCLSFRLTTDKLVLIKCAVGTLLKIVDTF
jgi:hypothetical protein